MPTPEEKKEREKVKKLNDLELLTEKMKNTILQIQVQLKSLNSRQTNIIISNAEYKRRVAAVESLKKISDKLIQSLRKDLETVSKRLEKIESTDSDKSIKKIQQAILKQQKYIVTLTKNAVKLKNDVKKAFEDQRELNTTIAKNFEILTGLVKALKKKKSELEAAEAMTEISKTGQPESDGSSSSGNKKRKGMRTLKL